MKYCFTLQARLAHAKKDHHDAFIRLRKLRSEAYLAGKTVWAFYLSNGSIERRYCDNTLNRGQVKEKYPFEIWYPKLRVLKTIREEEENPSEICPKNPHAHHLKPHALYDQDKERVVGYDKKCPFCGVKLTKKRRKKQ